MLKKILIFAVLCASLFAYSIDAASAKATFVAFKGVKKLAVNGSVDKIKYRFKRKNGTLDKILKGSTASFSMDDINLANPVKNANFKRFFTALLKDKNAKVTFKKITMGENQGIILARIKINKTNRNIPLSYVLKSGILSVKGLIDLDDYKCEGALANLSKNVKEHLGLTWGVVEIAFTINLEKKEAKKQAKGAKKA